MEKLRSEVGTGRHVEVRGEPWLVVDTDGFDACTLLTLRGIGDGNLGETSRVLTPFDRVRPIARASAIVVASRRRALGAAARAVTLGHAWHESWTAATALIDLLPWQLEPALTAVSGATRILLADGVGLGKTIEAALVLSELRARGLISRALILTPAALREQWAAELADRFDLTPAIFDHAFLLKLAATLPVGVNPWTTCDLIVSSIDLVKRPDVRAGLDGAPFDALVVDEAHHLTPGTDRGAVVSELAARVPWVVLATATPHSGDERAFAFLCAIGACDAADQIRIFRRTAHEVGRPRTRRVHLHAVNPSSLERDVLEAVLAYTRAIWRQWTEGDERSRLVASVIARRAASSPRALLQTLRRRRELVGGAATPPVEQCELPWEETDAADAIEPDAVLGHLALATSAIEVEWLDRLIALASGLGCSSKLRVVRRLLERTTEPLIVFTEYRDTIDDLREWLDGATTLAVLHGGLAPHARREAIQDFVSGRARVLLATDAAGEGLNLQARCRIVLNIELPWNPLRLEQRIGRVDRLGQARRVHALHLFHRGSFEDEVLARLIGRARRAGVELGRQCPDERAVAAAVFGGGALDTSIAPMGASSPVAMMPAVGRALIDRRAAALMVAAPGAKSSRPRSCVISASRRSLASGIVLLFEWDVHDALGRLACRHLLPLSIGLTRPLRLHRRSIRSVVEQLSHAPCVREAVEREERVLAQSASHALHAPGHAITHRIAHILELLNDARRPALFQASLFDRRAEQRARASDAAAAAWREHLAHRAHAARALTDLRLESPPRLIAAWPIDDRVPLTAATARIE